jgi:hypothetical protein
VLLVAAKYLGHSTPDEAGAALSAPDLDADRAYRARQLPVAAREGVSRGGEGRGAGDLPDHVAGTCSRTRSGPIVVSATLTIGTAILLEAGALVPRLRASEPPTPALGALLNEGQDQGIDKWWLVTFPGVVIVIIVLCINFVGDGLRDALDPTQRRVRT